MKIVVHSLLIYNVSPWTAFMNLSLGSVDFTFQWTHHRSIFSPATCSPAGQMQTKQTFNESWIWMRAAQSFSIFFLLAESGLVDFRIGRIVQKFFCSTGLPLASTRWVRSTVSSHYPLSSKQRHLWSSMDYFFLWNFFGNSGPEASVPTLVLFCRLPKFIFKFELHLPPCTRDNQYIIHGSHFLLYQPKSI